MLVFETQPTKSVNQFLGDITEQEFSSVSYPTKYSYVYNNPLSLIDPTGFGPDDPIIPNPDAEPTDPFTGGTGDFFLDAQFRHLLNMGIRNPKRIQLHPSVLRSRVADHPAASEIMNNGSSSGNGIPDEPVIFDSQTVSASDYGISVRVGTDIDDLIAPVRGMVVGRGPNGRRLSEMLIRQMAGAALAKLRQARRTGTGRGSTIGAAVFQNDDGLNVSIPNVAGADGLVSQADGAIGRTSAASAGASAIFVLLPDRVDSSPVGRGAPQFVRQAINASSVDAAGLPVIVIGPRGMPRTGLMFEAIFGLDSDIIGVVDEVPIR